MLRRGRFFELRAAGHVMQDFPQLVAEVINLCVSIARILGQRLVQNLLEPHRRGARPHLHQSFRLIVNHRVTHIDS